MFERVVSGNDKMFICFCYCTALVCYPKNPIVLKRENEAREVVRRVTDKVVVDKKNIQIESI